MSATTSFRDLLKYTSETVERPRPLAAGHYIGTIKNIEFGQSRQRQTPFVRLFLTPEAESEDVPAGANEGINLANTELRRDMYITPKSVYRIGDMLDAVLGKDTGRTFDERLPDLRGARVMFAVTQRANDDGTEVFNDIGNIVAAD